MKKTIFLSVSCLLLTGFSGAVENTDKNDDLIMKAIVRSDNDFVTYNDKYSARENIPEIVSKKIQSVLEECRTDDIRYDKSKECKYIVFKVKYTDTISIYISKIYLEPSLRYYFIVYDSKASRITDKPPWINGEYMENKEKGFHPKVRLLEKPLISFSSFVLNNSKGTMVVKVRIHNGTFNSVIDYHYSIDAYMNLNNFLFIESKAIILGPDGNDCLIKRTFKDNIIVSTLKCENEEPKLMGSVRLEISANNVRIVSKEVNDKIYENSPLLVTITYIEEETFLNKGMRWSNSELQ